MSSSPMARPGRKPPKQHLARRPSPLAQEHAGKNASKSTRPKGAVDPVSRQTSATLHKLPSTLDKLPPELREMIYKIYFEPEIGPFSREKGRELVLSHVGTPTPALLIALRSDKELYQEALKTYYQATSLALTKRNFKSLAMLSKRVFPLVRSVVVEIDGISSRSLFWSMYISRISSIHFDESLVINPKQTDCTLAKVTGLTSLTFQMHARNISVATAVVAQILPVLPSLTEIKCIVLLRKPLDDIIFQWAREDMNKLVGVTGIETQGSLVDLKIDDEKRKDAVMWAWTLKVEESGP